MIEAETQEAGNAFPSRMQDEIENLRLRDVSDEIKVVRSSRADEVNHSLVGEQWRECDNLAYTFHRYQQQPSSSKRVPPRTLPMPRQENNIRAARMQCCRPPLRLNQRIVQSFEDVNA